jgi:nicotinamidase-related amidase
MIVHHLPSIRKLFALCFLALCCLTPSSAQQPVGPDTKTATNLQLNLRTRVDYTGDGTRWHVLHKRAEWDAKQTAVVICDMWDKHWCNCSTKRVAEMAPRMNEVVKVLRDRGALIIHCPSDTMEFYKDTPQRKLAQQAPVVETAIPLQRWCRLDPKSEAPLPIDDADGGCDDPQGAKNYRAWSRQIASIEIKEGDAVTDSAEAYYLMKQRGITNVIVMGVHTNMCVLGRPFSIRQMKYQGMNVVLMRDMTDTMYNPAKRPFVSHFTGNDLVAEHIEKYWCPTITSVDLLGGKPFVFPDDKRPHLVIVANESEYQSTKTLPVFAQQYLGKDFRVSLVHGSDLDGNDFHGLEALRDADLAMFAVRRRTPSESQLALIRKFIAAGKPVVGLRTSSHAFAPPKGKSPPAGHAEWVDFGKEIFGCNYTGHHAAKDKTVAKVKPDASKHPILTGLPAGEMPLPSSLYKSSPLSASATPLLVGRVEGQPEEPIAWTYTHPGGGRVFYTSLGHPDEFQSPFFRRLLLNGIYWSAGLEVPAKLDD